MHSCCSLSQSASLCHLIGGIEVINSQLLLKDVQSSCHFVNCIMFRSPCVAPSLSIILAWFIFFPCGLVDGFVSLFSPKDSFMYYY